MLSQLFLLIQLILKAIGLWESFNRYIDAQREADRVAKDQARNQAVDAQKNAQTEAEFDKQQDTIVGNKP